MLFKNEKEWEAYCRKVEAETAEFERDLDTEPKFSERDLWAVFQAAIETTTEGCNGEYGYYPEREREKFREVVRKGGYFV